MATNRVKLLHEASQLSQDWYHNGFELTVKPTGHSHAYWRIYKSCDEDPTSPCDEYSEHKIIDGGRAELVFDQVSGTTASGEITYSNDNSKLVVGQPVTLTLLPRDTALLKLNANWLFMCGPHHEKQDPQDASACGA